MKILFVNNFFTDFGGAENIIIKEALMLQNDGHEVSFLPSAENRSKCAFEIH